MDKIEYSKVFNDGFILSDYISDSNNQVDYSPGWVLSKLPTSTLSLVIEQLLEVSALQNNQQDIILSDAFFLLSELRNIDIKISDFCLDVSTILGLDEDSRTASPDLQNKFSKIKPLADIRVC